MEFENLVCGNCGGTDFHKLSDLEYRCKHCLGLLVRTARSAVPRPVYVEPEPLEVVEASPVFVRFLVGLIVALFVMILIGVLLTPKRGGTNSGVSSTPPGPRPYNVAPPPPGGKAKLKTEVIGKVKGSFGNYYIKCMLTNTGDTVITEPSVVLMLYKGDTKLDSVFGDAALKYLKPGATTPVWVKLYNYEDYTSAVVLEKNPRGMENSDRLFPNLKFSGVAMKITTGNSSYNDQIYKEKFFDVGGTVENELYDKVAPELYVIYYDSKSQVIGVQSDIPPELKRGEKAQFDIGAGETQLFGVPVRYEILAVDPNYKRNECLANKVCG
jgi:hypothetical protein